MAKTRWVAFFGTVLVAATAAAEEAWETIQTQPIVIKARDVPGTGIREIWAEGDMAAPAQDIQSALMDADGYAKFMPYAKESRTVGQPEADGGQWVYTRLDFSALVSSRDYVVKTYVDEKVGEDGTGTFRNHWKSDSKKLPKRANIVRLPLNQGSWTVTSSGPNKSHAVYRFMVDPGGWLPAFAANIGNTSGVTDTFLAVEKEAQRRARDRAEAASAKPGP
ncbi:MAG: hypothetical protein WBV82_13620 [Myxococcaceae bacterium]